MDSQAMISKLESSKNILDILKNIKTNAIQIPDIVLSNIYQGLNQQDYSKVSNHFIDLELDYSNLKIKKWIDMIESKIPTSRMTTKTRNRAVVNYSRHGLFGDNST